MTYSGVSVEKDYTFSGHFGEMCPVFPGKKATFRRTSPEGNLIPAISRLDQGFRGCGGWKIRAVRHAGSDLK